MAKQPQRNIPKHRSREQAGLFNRLKYVQTNTAEYNVKRKLATHCELSSYLTHRCRQWSETILNPSSLPTSEIILHQCRWWRCMFLSERRHCRARRGLFGGSRPRNSTTLRRSYASESSWTAALSVSAASVLPLLKMESSFSLCVGSVLASAAACAVLVMTLFLRWLRRQTWCYSLFITVKRLKQSCLILSLQFKML